MSSQRFTVALKTEHTKYIGKTVHVVHVVPCETKYANLFLSTPGGSRRCTINVALWLSACSFGRPVVSALFLVA